MKLDDGRYAVKSYVFIAEMWGNSADSKVRASDDPDRIEMVTLLARERGCPVGLSAMAEVKRHALSPKPSLGKWDDVAAHEMGLQMFEDDADRTVH
jgi:hypothetical protein